MRRVLDPQPSPGLSVSDTAQPLPQPRTVVAGALSVWLQINPDSDAAELLEVLAREGVLLAPENVESGLGSIRPNVTCWLLQKDGVVLYVARRTVVGVRRVMGALQTALLLGKEPPVLPVLTRPVRQWGPADLPADLPALLALHAEGKAALAAALVANHEAQPVQAALGRINEAIRAAGIPGWPKQKPAFARFGGDRPPLPDRTSTLCGIVLRFFRDQLTEIEIQVLEHALAGRQAEKEQKA